MMTDVKFSTVRLGAEHIHFAHEIEKSCFSDPWSEESLGLFTGAGGMGLICFSNGIPAAYCGVMTVLDEADIARIATVPAFRRMGVAKRLLGSLFGLLASMNISRVTLDVRESNIPALELYRSSGFTVIGMRRDYYNRPREAAVIMEKKL